MNRINLKIKEKRTGIVIIKINCRNNKKYIYVAYY